MSQSEKREPNSEDQDPDVEEAAKDAEETAQGGEVPAEEQEEPKEAEEPASQAPAWDPRLANDARFSRLMKMRSSYVTEEALGSIEEKSKPKEPEPPEGEEIYDEEYYDDEIYDEEFEDDEYEEEEAPAAAAAAEPEPEPAHEEENEDEVDHRVAQLRKLRRTFVTDKDLEVKSTGGKEPEVYKEVKVQLVVCPNCQSEEPRIQKICTKCGAKLPNITAVEEEKYNPGTLNKAVLKYYDAVKKLRDESWSVDEFVEFLHERIELTGAHVDGIHELIDECGSREWMPDATELLLKSTTLLETAVGTMIEKVNDVVAEHVETDQDEFPLEDEEGNPIEPPASLEEKILGIDFEPDLLDIKKANGMMLDTLKQIDDFQKKAQAELEVSM